MIYFTADTHFYHSNIINLNSRPFANMEEMHRVLIQNWNAYVSDHDEIYILGDFMFNGTGEEANRILKRLRGKKYLIRGNHDKFLKDDNFDCSAFEWVKDYYVLDYKKRKYVLFHYPILEWQGFFGDAVHLYGHVHNSSKDPAQAKRLEILTHRAMNVGVDVNEYFPVSIDRVLKVCG
ncbi:MAG: metallophosphoesterase family protein [Defluviitaleaceae bacterium]|nr:metallophosphoesterase family protein [Defluviitaleaceae bacterium]